MNSKTGDVVMIAVIAIVVIVMCAIGGIEHQNTIAGSIAKFVWSLK